MASYLHRLNFDLCTVPGTQSKYTETRKGEKNIEVIEVDATLFSTSLLPSLPRVISPLISELCSNLKLMSFLHQHLSPKSESQFK